MPDSACASREPPTRGPVPGPQWSYFGACNHPRRLPTLDTLQDIWNDRVFMHPQALCRAQRQAWAKGSQVGRVYVLQLLLARGKGAARRARRWAGSRGCGVVARALQLGRLGSMLL